MQLEAAVEDDARQRRKAFCRMGAHDCEYDVGAVARSDDRDAVGEPLQHVLGGHACDQHAHHFALEQLLVAADHRALDGVLKIAHRGRVQQGLFGEHVGLRRDVLQRFGDRGHLCRLTPVGHHRRGVCVLAGDLDEAQFDNLSDLGRRAVLGLDRQHDGCAEVGRDAGVGVQLARGGDVRVVAADDHHGVTPVCHVVEAVDDVGDGRVGIVVQLLIAHAHALLVGQARGGVGQQQIEDVVAVFTQPGDGPEHPDLGHGGRQPVQDAERDRRLAGIALGRGHVDRG